MINTCYNEDDVNGGNDDDDVTLRPGICCRILLFVSVSCVPVLYLVSERKKTLAHCRVMCKLCGPKAWSTNQTVTEYQGPTCGQKSENQIITIVNLSHLIIKGGMQAITLTNIFL